MCETFDVCVMLSNRVLHLLNYKHIATLALRWRFAGSTICDRYSPIAERSALFGTRLDGLTTVCVKGSVVTRFAATQWSNHLLMASRSYVFAAAVITGSTINLCESGHMYAGFASAAADVLAASVKVKNMYAGFAFAFDSANVRFWILQNIA